MDVSIESIQKHRRRAGWFHWAILFVGICLMVYGMNHDAVVQEVPVVDSAALQQLQRENELLTRKVADYKALSANLAGRLKEANGQLAKLEEERNVLAHSSVPSQPVILEAVRREASTPAGFRQVVARSFGVSIANRIQVRE